MGESELYDTDFVGWTEQQAHLLRAAGAARINVGLDWERLAEEIEDLGNAEVAALASQVRRIIVHLLKLQFSPATQRRGGWVDSIADARGEIEDKISEFRSLRPRLPAILNAQRSKAARQADSVLRQYGEFDAADAARAHGGTYTDDQILGEWFPEPRH